MAETHYYYTEDRMIQSCPPESFRASTSEDPRYSLNDSTYTKRSQRYIVIKESAENGSKYAHHRDDYESYSDSADGVIRETVSPEENFLSSNEPNSDTSGHVTTDRYGFHVSPGTRSNVSNRDLLLPVQKLRKRESKWLEMLDNWPNYMNKKYEKVRSRCRKGIPPSIRGRAWKYLSGAAYHMENVRSKAVFEQLDVHPGDPCYNDEIKKDISRQFPEHELFSREGPYGKLGQEDLFRLLKAYTVLHPEEGYCQGQAPVAATLLMHMPLKDAFYCFVQICHKYLPGYYSPGLEAIQLDGDILYEILRKKSNISFKHLKKNNVDPVLYMVEWFMCIYCRTLPWATVLRVWDIFFCEGVKVLFKVAVVLFKYSLGSKEQVKQFPGMYEIVERLRHLPPEIMEEEFLIERIHELKLDDEDLEKIHYKTFKRRQELKHKKAKETAVAKTI